MNAWCANAPLYLLIIQHARDPNDLEKECKPSCVNAVVTRKQERKMCTKTKSLPTPELMGSDVRQENTLKAL